MGFVAASNQTACTCAKNECLLNDCKRTVDNDFMNKVSFWRKGPHYTTLFRFGMDAQGSSAASGALRKSLRTSSKPVRNQDFA